MKKLVVTILGISALAIGGSAALASAQSTTRPPETPNPTLAAEAVDNILVPLDVLLYAQTEYQGYAVTHAHKSTRNGQQVYRLQVDRSDTANDGNSFYLFYDMSWKLLGEEKIAKPVKKTELQKSMPANKPKEDQKKPEPENVAKPRITPKENPESTNPPTSTDDTPADEPGSPDNDARTGQAAIASGNNPTDN